MSPPLIEECKHVHVRHLQVINEALRCGNVVKFVHRKALKDVKFRGKSSIKKNGVTYSSMHTLYTLHLQCVTIDLLIN